MSGKLFETAKSVQAFTPASRSSATTLYNGAVAASAAGIDLKDFDDAKIIVNCGVLNDSGSLAVTLWTADVDDAEDASLAQVTNNDSVGAAFATVDGSADDDKAFVLGFNAFQAKRYLFVRVVQTGAVAMLYNVGVELCKAKHEPVTQDNAVNWKHS